MNGASLFALLALAPSASGAAAPAAASTVTVRLCDGGNAGSTIDIPLQRAPASPDKNGDCQAKGCHAGNSRKRCHI